LDSSTILPWIVHTRAQSLSHAGLPPS
jgi:hypothetical protein